MHVTYAGLARAAAVAAIVSGALYVGIQFIHPEETLETVSTDAWTMVAWLTVAMALLALVGITGIYLRQVEPIGVLGLLGFVLFGAFYLLPIVFSFGEAAILPLIADDAPNFVENYLGLFNGEGTDGSLGALELVPTLSALLYVLGGVLFGIGIFRARVLSRGAGMLLAIGAAAALLAGLVPHNVGRFAAVPVGLAFIWLGYSLWTNPGTDSSALSERPHSEISGSAGT
ncbi:MAG: hypothetical protein K0T01_2617 [Acidimicrobiia bacterium]|nr:hypothetical protein [Acidimicrobiia bacterium]